MSNAGSERLAVGAGGRRDLTTRVALDSGFSIPPIRGFAGAAVDVHFLVMRRLVGARRTRLKQAVTVLASVLALGSGTALAGTNRKPPPRQPKQPVPSKPSCTGHVDPRHPCQRPRY
ncbi:MAG: hypothetical protein ACXVYM_02515 [Gaiellaceae bacterium]